MSVQVFVLLYSLPLIFLGRHMANERFAFAGQWRQQHVFLLWLALGLLLRALPLWDAGFHYDTGTYKAWALKLSDPNAPLKIYEPGYFADYPPLYMYVLGAIGWLARQFSWESSPHFNALIKLPAVLADIAIASLLYRELRQRLGAERGLLLASLYWLNPVVLFDSVFWGQTEAIQSLLLLLGWRYWQQQRLWLSSLSLAALVAFKPQGLFFAYIYGLATLLSHGWRCLLKQTLIGLVGFILIILPFAWEQDADWILRLYFSTADTYNYLSVNAYNLWAFFGGNWNRGEFSFAGLNLQIWAMLLGGGSLTALGIHTGLKLKHPLSPQERGDVLAWSFALCSMLFFLLAPRMHERYILSIIPMLALLSAQPGVRALLLLWTAGALLNMAFVFHHYIGLNQVAPADGFAIRAISGLNLLAGGLLLALYLAPQRLHQARQFLTQTWQRWPAWELSEAQRERFGRPHALSLLMLALLAFGLGSFKLGARNYPTQGLELQNGQLIYHFAQPVQAQTALIFAATGSGKLQIEAKQGSRWQTVLAETELNNFYKLHELSLHSHAATREYRLRIKDSAQFRLNELGLLNLAEQALVPMKVSGQAQAAYLVDEPDSWIPHQGYFASTYFDEIYHARTAHEYLHQAPIYETTHPPLGKWLISQGIELFGMNPFGMRIAGVAATALIVSVLAWGGWLLGGSLRALWITGLLGLFEFSRYSIGRYSTIDSFLILFLLLSALCLWLSFCRHRTDDPLKGWQLQPALFAAGLFLGAAIAVKWSALYFGFGLFLWFAYGLLRQTAALRLRLILHAGLCFALLPLSVYYLAYAPFLACLPQAPSLWSTEGVAQVLKSQVDMFDYHSKLTATHPFSAAFYTWPILWKPLWLYTGENMNSLRSSITLIGNPLIWWTGLLAFLALASRKLRWPEADRVWLIACIASLFLPWMAVSRISFIYHYYPIVPFLILLLGVSLARWPWRQGWAQAVPALFVALSSLLFLWFYPAISGIPMNPAWFSSLHWLPGWWML